MPAGLLLSRDDEVLGEWAKNELGLLGIDGLVSRPSNPPAAPLTARGGLVPRFGQGLRSCAPGRADEVYELKPRPMGWGSSGEVLVARHRRTGVLRAVKKIHKDQDDSTAQTEERRRHNRAHEVEALLRLDHPNVVRLFEVFEDEVQQCLVLELLQGGSLLDQLMPQNRPVSPLQQLSECLQREEQAKARSEPLPGASPPLQQTLQEHEAARLFWQMLSAVLHLHGHQVVHRDLKLEHFVFSEDKAPGKAPVLKLVDFGLAYPLAASEPLLPGGIGTRAYAAPEVVEGGQLSAHLADRTDVWSLGVCLHCMLTGRFLRRSDSWKSSEVCSVAGGDGSALPAEALHSARGTQLSPASTDLLRQMLQLAPERRPSAATLVEHRWLAFVAQEEFGKAAALLEPRLTSGIFSAAAAGPRLRQLLLLAVARQLEDADTTVLQLVFRTMEVLCQGRLCRTTMKAVAQRPLCDRLGSGREDVIAFVRELLRVLDVLDADGSGSLGFTELLAAAMLLETKGYRADGFPGLLAQVDLAQESCAVWRAFDMLSLGGETVTSASLYGCLRGPQKASGPETDPKRLPPKPVELEAMVRELSPKGVLWRQDFLAALKDQGPWQVVSDCDHVPLETEMPSTPQSTFTKTPSRRRDVT